VQSYGRTTYSYAQTLADKLDLERNSFSFVVGETNYVDGHCIDHRDTRLEELGYYKKTSSVHPVNHIPEPPVDYWGLTCRRALVADLRKRREGYSQWVFYPSKPLLTNSGTPVPMGVLFMQHAADSYAITNGWSIPWKDPLHRSSADKGDYRTQLRGYALNRHSQSVAKTDLLGVGSRFFPKTFVYEKSRLDEEIFGKALRLPETLENPYDHFCVYRMETFADRETVPSWSPTTFNFFLSQMERHKDDPYFREKTSYWWERFMGRSESLRRNDFPEIMAEDVNLDVLIQNVQRAESFDLDDRVQDHLRQLKSHSKVKREPAASHVGGYEDYERPQVEPPSPLEIRFLNGKGSINAIASMNAEEFRHPRSLVLKTKDCGSITEKVHRWLDLNRMILTEALRKGTITEFKIEGGVTPGARKELRALFGLKFKET